jgi:hypothetical protein
MLMQQRELSPPVPIHLGGGTQTPNKEFNEFGAHGKSSAVIQNDVAQNRGLLSRENPKSNKMLKTAYNR